MTVNSNTKGGWGWKNGDKHGYDYNRDVLNVGMYL